MINKAINDIDISSFESLISNGVNEGKTIEYKQELKLQKDEDRREFLADVSSFANASGGDLIFGIKEDRDTGLPVEVSGISLENYDEEIRKIESLIRDGISPRLAGIEIRKYEVSGGNIVLLMRIPKGWNSPHQITFRGHDKFYTRSANGKYKLDVFELRNAFLLSETVVQRIRNFKESRIMSIISNEATVQLKPHAKIMLQLIPLTTFQNNVRYDHRDIANTMVRLSPLGGGSRDWRYNLEGILSHVEQRGQNLSDSYLQVFFNGIIETVNATILEPYQKNLFIPAGGGLNYEKEIVDVTQQYLAYQKQINVDIPILVFISLIGVKNYKIESSARLSVFDQDKKIDRDILQLPEVIFDTYSVNVELALKEVFDMIWNASGLERSLNYNEQGVWSPKS